LKEFASDRLPLLAGTISSRVRYRYRYRYRFTSIQYFERRYLVSGIFVGTFARIVQDFKHHTSIEVSSFSWNVVRLANV
jgi:hypothetical protein